MKGKVQNLGICESSSFRFLKFHKGISFLDKSVFFSAVFSALCLVLVTLDQFLLVTVKSFTLIQGFLNCGLCPTP